MNGGEALTAADTPGGAVGGSGNPGSALVAERQDARSGFEGLGIIEDGHALVEAIQGGSWMGTALGVAFTGLDVASAVSDPIGTLISMGLGWALEWVWPFNELFNALAGDAAQVEANAQTWENVAVALGAAGAQLEEDTTTCLSDMAGDTVEAIRTSAGGVAEHVQAASQWAQAMADGLRMASGIVQVVHDVVRQAISDLTGTICSVAIEEACTLGLATALVIEQITTRVAALSTHVFEAIGHLKTAFSSFHGLLSELGRLWNTLTGAISSMFHRGAAAVTPHGPVAGATAAIGIGGAPHGVHGPHASAKPTPPPHAKDPVKDEPLVFPERKPWKDTKRDKPDESHNGAKWGEGRDQAQLNTLRDARVETKQHIENLEAELRAHGVDPKDVTQDRITDTWNTLISSGRDPREIKHIIRTATDLSHSRGHYSRLGEEVGIVGAESKLESQGMELLPNTGGTGAGNATGDIYATALDKKGNHQAFHVVEAKGYSSKLGTRLVDGTPFEQGSPTYVRDIMLNDTQLHGALARDAALREAILKKEIPVIADVYRTRHPHMSCVTLQKTTAVPLDDDFIKKLEEILKGHPAYTPLTPPKPTP
ncbi:hypothetical protein QU668_08185 [Schaalia sp. HMT-877]|nr:hypothetical protein HMPREF1550_00427 [Actinomyces sp. oral taxon 877 str. F0543]WLD79510.1 hypothetical protein QU668_08185 [Schaalia sp. HMT-877]